MLVPTLCSWLLSCHNYVYMCVYVTDQFATSGRFRSHLACFEAIWPASKLASYMRLCRSSQFRPTRRFLNELLERPANKLASYYRVCVDPASFEAIQPANFKAGHYLAQQLWIRPAHFEAGQPPLKWADRLRNGLGCKSGLKIYTTSFSNKTILEHGREITNCHSVSILPWRVSRIYVKLNIGFPVM